MSERHMSETIIIGEFTISKLRSGEAVEFDNGVTVLPASDLATTEALRARAAKLEAALIEARPLICGCDVSNDHIAGVRDRLDAALKDASPRARRLLIALRGGAPQ